MLHVAATHHVCSLGECTNDRLASASDRNPSVQTTAFASAQTTPCPATAPHNLWFPPSPWLLCHFGHKFTKTPAHIPAISLLVTDIAASFFEKLETANMGGFSFGFPLKTNTAANSKKIRAITCAEPTSPDLSARPS